MCVCVCALRSLMQNIVSNGRLLAGFCSLWIFPRLPAVHLNMKSAQLHQHDITVININ